MKKLVLKEGVRVEDELDLLDERPDVEQLVAVAQQSGYEIDAVTAFSAWSAYSDSLMASWLVLDGHELLPIILRYCRPQEEGVHRGR